MSEDFIATLENDVGLTTAEKQVLRSVDVRNYQDLHSLVQAFPSIATAGVELSKLSNAAYARVADGFASFSEKAARSHPQVSFGAFAPDEAVLTRGAVLGMPAPTRRLVAMGAPESPIDLRSGQWPVRDQKARGTCVSFGTVACVEHALGGGSDMSEQFLYWAIKTASSDPDPDVDGTWLEFSREALATSGVCGEQEWPYVGIAVSPVSGAAAGVPTQAATTSAAAHRPQATLYERNPKRAAGTVLNALKTGKPVAICLPVFSDPMTPDGATNWTTSVGWAFGHILNPPPTAKVTGGHCVCIIGYSPDPEEPTGGHFIVRNSWSDDWGSENPSLESHSPEPGYGYVAGSYLNKYTWEIMQL